MRLEKIKEILGGDVEITQDGLYGQGNDYIVYNNGDGTACVDGNLTADELEAIAAYMRRTQGARK